MTKQITMPDRIAYDQVVAALGALGLDSGNHIKVTMTTEEVTVGTRTSGGILTRTYTVNGPDDRYGPKDSK